MIKIRKNLESNYITFEAMNSMPISYNKETIEKMLIYYFDIVTCKNRYYVKYEESYYEITNLSLRDPSICLTTFWQLLVHFITGKICAPANTFHDVLVPLLLGVEEHIFGKNDYSNKKVYVINYKYKNTEKTFTVNTNASGRRVLPKHLKEKIIATRRYKTINCNEYKKLQKLLLRA